jgi:hypothetical protein
VPTGLSGLSTVYEPVCPRWVPWFHHPLSSLFRSRMPENHCFGLVASFSIYIHSHFPLRRCYRSVAYSRLTPCSIRWLGWDGALQLLLAGYTVPYSGARSGSEESLATRKPTSDVRKSGSPYWRLRYAARTSLCPSGPAAHEPPRNIRLVSASR